MGLPKSVAHDQLPSEIQKQLDFLSKAGAFGMLSSLSHEKQMRDIFDQVTRLEAANRRAFGYLLDPLRLDALGTKTLGENISRIVEQQASASRVAFQGMDATLAALVKAQEEFQQPFGNLVSRITRAQIGWESSVAKWPTLGIELGSSGFFASLRAMKDESERLAHVIPLSAGIERRILDASLKNIHAFTALQSSRLGQVLSSGGSSIILDDLRPAADFVLDYGQFVLPALKRNTRAEYHNEKCEAEFTWRAEEIGPRLEAELMGIDSRLVELRRSAWAELAKGGAAALRLAAHAARELFKDVLHALAPDHEVKSSPAWSAHKEPKEQRPTRAMRVEFLLSSEPEKLITIRQFLASLDKAHGFAHTFPNDREVVRVGISELEKCTYLLIVYARRRRGT